MRIGTDILVFHFMQVHYISFSIVLLMPSDNANENATNQNESDTENDCSDNPITITPYDVSRNLVIGDGWTADITQAVDASGVVNTNADFITTAVDSDVQITQDLSGQAFTYYEDTSSNALVLQIKDYASRIQCTDFQGKGTIDDYSVLFQAASQIANETAHMQLNVDVEGFDEFASAAEDLSALFNGFILKLQNINIIDDTAFLQSVLNALEKIWQLSETFGRFKQTILATSQIQLPVSAHETKVAIESVVGQLNCAMKYINHFVDASYSAPDSANLSDIEQSIIDNAVATIENWNVLCTQGVSIAMSSNPDIVYIQSANETLKQNTAVLVNAKNKLRQKLTALGL